MSEQKNNQNSIENKPKKKLKLHYSMLTVVLLICIIELTVSAVQNINKNIHFASKIKGLENKRNEELSKNKQLKSEIENFNSDMILESIARNNLKMAGKDEILIIMNKPEIQQDEEPVNVKAKGKKKN